jgi:hypothetical protein
LIDALEDGEYYTAKQVVSHAVQHGLISDDPLTRQRAYAAMSRLIWKMAAERMEESVPRSWPGWEWKATVLR